MGKLRRKSLASLGVSVVPYDVGLDYAPVPGCERFFRLHSLVYTQGVDPRSSEVRETYFL